ncbi:MAG: 50S ribosomal protein L17 [Anaerolineaceae bacterium]
MRHQIAGIRLGRSKDERIGLRRTMVNQLFDHERITTTQAKALYIRGEAEKMITLARRSIKGTPEQKVYARRLVAAHLGNNNDMVKKLFDVIAPRFENRNGGYTRISKLGPRQGDCADMVLIELIEE